VLPYLRAFYLPRLCSFELLHFCAVELNSSCRLLCVGLKLIVEFLKGTMVEVSNVNSLFKSCVFLLKDYAAEGDIHIMKNKITRATAGYAELLRSLKERIRSAQVKAALSVNRELILLYWQIGREILSRQTSENWGAKVIDRLAADLKKEFTEMKGFSTRNLKYMRAFAEAYPDEQFVQQVVAQIPWGHIIPQLKKSRWSWGKR